MLKFETLVPLKINSSLAVVGDRTALGSNSSKKNEPLFDKMNLHVKKTLLNSPKQYYLNTNRNEPLKNTAVTSRGREPYLVASCVG